MTTLYLTEWVIARGILVVRGKRSNEPGELKVWYWVEFPSDNCRRAKWCLGRSVFLTLAEAEKDALARWEEHAERMQKLATEAVVGLERVRNGQLLVNTPGDHKISNYRAFTQAQPE